MTLPWRRITLHLSQIFLTLGLTFTVPFLLLVPVDDATAGQVVRRELHDHSVLGKDADVVLPHLAADVRQYAVPVGELDAEHGVRQRLDDAPLDLDGAFLLRHILRKFPCVDVVVLCSPLSGPGGPTEKSTLSGAHAQNRRL